MNEKTYEWVFFEVSSEVPFTILTRSVSDFETWVFDNLFVLLGKRKSSFLTSGIVSSLVLSKKLIDS
jgi:hypothetical protein